jgi:PEGA domain
MTGLSFALGAWFTLVAAEAGAAPGKDDVAEAHRRFQRATELYEENNLAGALAEFRRAYALAPSYKILYNVGQLCYLLQDFPCAYDSLTRYLDQGGTEVSGQRREEVQRDLARLQTRVARLRIVVDRPGAEVTVDNVSVGRSPIADPVMVSAGRPQVRVTLPGYAPVTRVIEVAGMDTATVSVQLSAVGAPLVPEHSEPPLISSAPPPQEQARPGHAPTLAWVATGVLAAGAGTTGALALWSSADLKEKRESLPADVADLESRSRRTRRLALATDILIGATAVAAGVATVLTLTRTRHGEVAVSLSPGGVGVEGSF